MIGIVDYGMGNLRSVQKAFEHVGAQAVVSSDPDQVQTFNRLVLPGVGAFGDGMDQLQRRGLAPAVIDFIRSGRPFLGICLGFQLIFDASEENAPSADAPIRGMGVLPGIVRRFAGQAFGPGRLKVPHMGWNTLEWTRGDPLLAGLSSGAAVYFVHSYYVIPNDRSVQTASCDYGGPFCATVWRDNIWATQFHPEKSQSIGLKMLANFAGL